MEDSLGGNSHLLSHLFLSSSTSTATHVICHDFSVSFLRERRGKEGEGEKEGGMGGGTRIEGGKGGGGRSRKRKENISYGFVVC